MKMSFKSEKLCLLFIYSLFGLCSARSGLYSEESPSSVRIEQCHDGCIKKFATDDMSCLQAPECSSCWDDCTESTKINKPIQATWSLGVTSMVRDNSLVATNIAWESASAQSDCLVTWEVSGGGLTGNLLTQSSNVELSLWPDTKYRVQVTCKNKQTGEMSRSLPLTLDTSNALVMVRVPTASSTSILVGDSTSSQIQDQNILLSDSNSRNIETNNNDDDNDDIVDEQKYYNNLAFEQQFESTVDTTSFLLMAVYENNKEIVMGSCAAITVFAAVLLAFIVSKRKSRQNVDKAPLVDNEVSVNVDVERLTIHV